MATRVTNCPARALLVLLLGVMVAVLSKGVFCLPTSRPQGLPLGDLVRRQPGSSLDTGETIHGTVTLEQQQRRMEQKQDIVVSCF